jgi:capsular exopolysaccharide synthesis family protein
MSRNFDLMRQMEGRRPLDWNRAVQAELPAANQKQSEIGYKSLTSNAALELVQRIFLSGTEGRPRLVVFAGVEHGNGCSGTAASVADALAENARGRVCIVEANFRSPGLPALFGTTNHYGLTDALRENAPIRSIAKSVNNDRLWFLSSGSLTADSPNLLSSERLKARFAELRAEFDFVIVDAPPMTPYSDAIALGKLSDGVVLVLEAESTRREAATAVVESLRSAQVEIIGAILNKRTFPIPEKIYRRL